MKWIAGEGIDLLAHKRRLGMEDWFKGNKDLSCGISETPSQSGREFYFSFQVSKKWGIDATPSQLGNVWVGQPFAIVMFSRGICVRSIDYVYYKYIMYLSLEVMVW